MRSRRRLGAVRHRAEYSRTARRPARQCRSAMRANPRRSHRLRLRVWARFGDERCVQDSRPGRGIRHPQDSIHAPRPLHGGSVAYNLTPQPCSSDACGRRARESADTGAGRLKSPGAWPPPARAPRAPSAEAATARHERQDDGRNADRTGDTTGTQGAPNGRATAHLWSRRSFLLAGGARRGLRRAGLSAGEDGGVQARSGSASREVQQAQALSIPAAAAAGEADGGGEASGGEGARGYGRSLATRRPKV